MPRKSAGPIIQIPDMVDEGVPLYVRLEEHIRALIIDGQLTLGTRLPSTRQMSKDLCCSRNTVVAALERLATEGYVESRHGSGTFVADDFPEAVLPKCAQSIHAPSQKILDRPVQISPAATRTVQAFSTNREKRPAFSRQPDTSFFPFELWAGLHSTVWKNTAAGCLNHQDPFGLWDLREAIVEHLALWRGLVCDPEQIMITSGTTHAMHFLARLLLREGDQCWVEEPGFLEAKSAIVSVGAKPVPLRCDAEGILVESGGSSMGDVKAAFLTPSHHHPLGMVMSEERREQILAWAERYNTWIIEDDHDSEIRHTGQPHPTLKASDTNDSVIYVGTFSKSMFQTIRLGFMILPYRLASLAARYRSATEVCPPLMIQPVMERFLTEGHFAAHLRRMRKVYLERKSSFTQLAAEILPSSHRLLDDDVGTHLVLLLDKEACPHVTDKEISKQLWDLGISATPLSNYHYLEAPTEGFVLGYGALLQDEMVAALRTLSSVLTASAKP